MSDSPSAPPATSTLWKPTNFAFKPCCANAVTSFSSHVPAAFQAEPAVGFAVSAVAAALGTIWGSAHRLSSGSEQRAAVS